MKRLDWRVILGVGLLIMGALFLLQSLNILSIGSGWLWSVPFALGGLVFLYVMLLGRQNWWAAIPGVTLLSLGALIAASEFLPRFADQFGGTLFLGGIGLAFLLVFLMNNEAWWALIPMGALATLAVVAGLDEAGSFETGSIFFLGLALTFALLAILPRERRRLRWAWIPALVLLVMGGLLALGAENMLVYVFPVGLILGGLYLVSLAFMKR